MKRTIIAGLIAIASFAAFAQPAAADTRSNPDRRIERVQTSDLDLTHEAGAAVLERRVRAAVRRVCGGQPGPMQLTQRYAYRKCVQEKLRKAIAQIDAPLALARFEDVRRERTYVSAYAG